MQYTKQDDYDEFNCIASKCPSSCCKGWEIVIDEESLERYEALAKKNGLFNGTINFEEGYFFQKNGRCTMLNDNDLCKLQLEYGEDMLCYTCGMYPRHVEEFDGVRELTLSLSCPETVRMLSGRNSLLSFSTYETDEEEEFYEDYDDFDYMLYSNLVDAREYIYEICSCTDISFGIKLEKILEFSKQLQLKINGGDYIDIATLKDTISDVPLDAWDADTMKNDFEFLFELEHLSDDWESELESTYNFFWGKTKNLEEVLNKYNCCLENLPDNIELLSLNVLLQLIYTYFCGAVYDDLIYPKAVLAVNFVRWVLSLSFAKGNGNIDIDTMITYTYRLAKEIEHSDNNLIAIDEKWEV